jgi:2-polyprenyl-6-methoxyphenol hydroxylase-like FAD-dependent oxidoreductase
MNPLVIIIGGGLGGLNLAQGLRKAGINFHVFERDVHANFRFTGYRIRVDDNGAAAIKSNVTDELWDRFQKSSAIVEMGMSVMNALDGQTILRLEGKEDLPIQYENDPYSADRKVTRDILLSGIQEHVSWGKEFKAYKITPTGVCVEFADGSFAEGTILVGADGWNSGVRKQRLPNHQVLDSSCRAIYGKTPLTENLISTVPEDSLHWMTFFVDQTNEHPVTLLLEPTRFKENEFRSDLPKDYMYWVLASRKTYLPIEDDNVLLNLTAPDAAELSLQMAKEWHPSMKLVLDLQDRTQTSAVRIATINPKIPAWEPSCVTLLGDSIHVMPPTAGVGANTALRDGAVLATLFAKEGVSVDVVGKYEQAMRKYAQEMVESSYGPGKKLVGLPDWEECSPITI